jgi:exodeoxyribonuclease VII large subunit
MRIGIVTSKSGAAVQDITDSILHRWPCAELFIFDVPVQGEGAAEKIAQTIRQINHRNDRLKLEVLIVGRGGGSMEDLWAFNEEVLARAIYDSTIPIISAVGHEVDVTIADLVADARASTPTKAGVIAVPDCREVLGRLEMTSRRLWQTMRLRREAADARFQAILASWIFREPLALVERAWQQVDEGSLRLGHAGRERFSRLRDQLDRILRAVQKIEPGRLISEQTLRLHRLGDTAGRMIGKILSQKQLQLAAAENKLEALNPRAVLRRGYSITVHAESGRLILRPEDVSAGDLIVTELADQKKIKSRVEGKSGPGE